MRAIPPVELIQDRAQGRSYESNRRVGNGMDLQELYQEVIVDHNRRPRNFGRLDAANRTAEGYNPLCGDRLTVYVSVDDNGVIRDVSFEGEGCAISVASASLMTDFLKGRRLDEAENAFGDFKGMVTARGDEMPPESLGKLAALGGVRAYPSRVKCATLCWHTMQAALHGEEQATTE